jgi:hypothetical protein
VIGSWYDGMPFAPTSQRYRPTNGRLCGDLADIRERKIDLRFRRQCQEMQTLIRRSTQGPATAATISKDCPD